MAMSSASVSGSSPQSPVGSTPSPNLLPRRLPLLLALGALTVTLATGVVGALRTWHRLPGPSMDSLALARLQADAGNWAAAAAEYRATYFVNWLGTGSIGPLADALQRAGDRAQLVEVLRRAARVDRNPDVHWNLAVLLAEEGKTDEALVAVDRLVGLYPDSASAHLNRAKLATSVQRHDLALPSLERAVALDPELAIGWLGLGLNRLSRRDLDGALAAFGRAAALDPSIPDAHNGMGLAHLERADYEPARAAFKAALALDPGSTAAHDNLARVEAAAGRGDGAAP
jgi:tetratricopeptide (TPR) repeat protein